VLEFTFLVLLQVPTDLWNKKADKPVRLKRRILLAHTSGELGGAGEAAATKNTVAGPWKPISPTNIIGLLVPVYEKKTTEEDMLEDDDRQKGKSLKAKAMLKLALAGRKKSAGAGDPAKAKPVDPVKAAEKLAREAAKRKRDAEKQRSKEERESQKKEKEKEKKERKEKDKGRDKDRENKEN
ncbi:hypothetical protein HDU67_007898, partial [Dinochytrium kinnereticum]